MKGRPVGRLFLELQGMRLDQSQSLPRQGLIFHGVIASIRHCSQCSGGQWLRREVSWALLEDRRRAAWTGAATAASPR
jgi:hypothetical protein